MTTVATATPVPTAARPAAHRRMSPMRTTALVGGLMYIVTFLASIPQLWLFANIVDHSEGFIAGHGSTTPVLWGSWLEVITALSGIATAVALYPVTRRVGKSAAVGFLASRVTEAGLILVGVVSVLTVVTMRTDLAGATGARADALAVTGHTLIELRQWTFLVGPGIMAGINGLFLAYVMYRSRLVPRIIPTIGLIGAPLILISSSGTLFGLWGPSLRTRLRAGPAHRRLGALARSMADLQGFPANGRDRTGGGHGPHRERRVELRPNHQHTERPTGKRWAAGLHHRSSSRIEKPFRRRLYPSISATLAWGRSRTDGSIGAGKSTGLPTGAVGLRANATGPARVAGLKSGVGIGVVRSPCDYSLYRVYIPGITKERVMSVRHALLALLSEGPKYGLQLRQEFEERTGEVWPLNVGQVYTTLQRPGTGRADRVRR